MLFFGTTIDGLQMGLCFAVIALGVYISYSILDFPDLSVDGTFPLGGVVCTILMLKLGLPPILATFLTFFVGLLAGTITGLLHVKFKISKLLSGIIVMTALLSVNLALTKLLTRNGYTTTIFAYRSENLTGIFDGKLTGVFRKRREGLCHTGDSACHRHRIEACRRLVPKNQDRLSSSCNGRQREAGHFTRTGFGHL